MVCGEWILRPRSIRALTVATLLRVSSGKVASGSVELIAGSTLFLSKFCFVHNPDPKTWNDHLNVTLRAPSADRLISAQVLLLDDEPDSYTGPSRQWDSLTCMEKRSHAKSWASVDGRIASSEGQVVQFMIGQHVKPRFWYVALSDCGGGGDLIVHWHAHFLNKDYGWAEELSAERHYAFVVLWLSAAVYAGLFAAQRSVNAALLDTADADSASSKAVHPFARLLLIGIALAWGETLLLLVHDWRYVYNGSGAPLAEQTAQLLAMSSNFVLVSLLLLVSEGKCVSYIMVPADVRRKFGLLGPFLLSCFVLELWGEHSVSQNYSTDYVYTTPCGWALIAMDLLFLCTYAWKLRKTYCAESEQVEGAFYRTWGIVYGAWFLVLPVTALLAQALLAPYAWYMVCTSVKKAVAALVYTSLVVGLWPGNVHTYFKLEYMRTKLPALLCQGMQRFADLDLRCIV